MPPSRPHASSRGAVAGLHEGTRKRCNASTKTTAAAPVSGNKRSFAQAGVTMTLSGRLSDGRESTSAPPGWCPAPRPLLVSMAPWMSLRRAAVSKATSAR